MSVAEQAPPEQAPPVLASRAEAITAATGFAAGIARGVIECPPPRRLPVRELATFDASGLLAITVPREHGGPDLGAQALAEVVRIIAAVDPAVAQGPQSHFLMVDVLSVFG